MVSAMGRRLFTIGHSNHSPTRLLELLGAAGIEVVADVRSRPYSRRVEHARKTQLCMLLASAGIRYWFVGDRLGGMPDDRSLWTDGSPDYQLMRERETYRAAIAEVVAELETGATMSLMCAEENPTRCHRRLLLGPDFEAVGVEIVHLRGSGKRVGNSMCEPQLSLFGG
jgi:uncharacterized protein (DUF488 family)